MARRVRAFGRRPVVRRGVVFTVAAGLLAALGLVVAAYLVPLPDRLVASDSTVVSWRDGSPAHVFLSSDDRWRIDVPLGEVDPDYVDALVRFEDKRFYEHPGVDPIAITRSAAVNVMHGKRLSGASTLTMQLVRLLEPRPRTYRSKVVEAFRAMQLELHMSKDEILSHYLRFAPYGRNIEGIEAASLAYFGHRSNELSADEIATLLAVPQNPNSRYPSPDNVEALERSRNEIARWLFDEGGLRKGNDGEQVSDRDFLEQLVESPVPSNLRDFPRHIPHVAFWLKAEHPDEERIDTTLDSGLQRIAEQALERRRDMARSSNIHHASVVVLDHRTGEVEALVGNFAFDDSPGSQLPSFDLPRSTGSLLKPLIYALAIERGVAHPEQLVVDIPFRTGSYTPSNFDGEFRGLVRLEDALSESLNVPFVHLLSTIRLDPFMEYLTMMGAESLNYAPGWYGLSAAVGGVEMTPLEIAGVYGALANEGVWHLPVVRKDGREGRRDDQRVPIQAFAPGATWLTRETLRIRDRPDLPTGPTERRRLGIHWKTGTSYGHLDAWAAGSGQSRTAVVWMGNHDRTPSVGLVGSRRSAPLLFDLLEAIETEAPDEVRPDDLVEIEICSYSGHLATDSCPHRKEAWALEDAVPVEPCPYHELVDVDVETGLSLAPNCRAGRDYRRESFLVWPSSVRRHLGKRYRYSDRIPPLMEGCDPVGSERPPHIVSPPAGHELVLIPGLRPDEQEVPLEAEASQSGRNVSWFVNGEFIASAAPHQRVWWTPSPGQHEVVVMDESGRASKREIVVRER